MKNQVRGYVRGTRAGVEGFADLVRRFATDHGGTCDVTAGSISDLNPNVWSAWVTVTLPDEPGEVSA